MQKFQWPTNRIREAVEHRGKEFGLVEAEGIEPPSEDLQEMATTRLVRELELALRPPADGLPKSQPI